MQDRPSKGTMVFGLSYGFKLAPDFSIAPQAAVAANNTALRVIGMVASLKWGSPRGLAKSRLLGVSRNCPSALDFTNFVF